ncbi:MAG: DUF2207 domain-containing protein, partial [Jiangellales bacterium]
MARKSMPRPARVALVLLAGLLGLLTLTGADDGRAYRLVDSDVAVTLAPDGSLEVRESITVAFRGAFTYGFRDIPLRPGEQVSDVSVSESGQAYAPGASTALQPGGPPGAFGVEPSSDQVRVVWRFDAVDQTRTFTLDYQFTGLTRAYDDVAEVNLQVWGEEWEQGLDRLTASLTAPADIDLAWGHPVYVRGDVTLNGPTVNLRAERIPAGQFVELRALVPRSALTSTAGATVVDGDGRAAIVAEESADAAEFQADADRIDALAANPLPWVVGVLALGLLPAALLVGVVFVRFGRERPSGYDREYEQEPPSDLPPALVPVLLGQGGTAGPTDFTATLFDLVRRGVYHSRPVLTEKSVWGGLRTEQVSDLELSRGRRDDLTPWEADVAEIVDDVLGSGPRALSTFRATIESDRKAMSTRFTSFKTNVADEVAARRWFVSTGVVALVAALLLLVAVGVGCVVAAGAGWRMAFPRWSDVVLLLVGAVCVLNSAVVLGALTQRKLWRRRSPSAQAEAERWEAFRRYLTDFPRLHEAPPASLALWERLLVYGIAFGIADRVLQAAHVAMPEAVAASSTIFWISPTGDLGSGASSLAIGDLAAGFGSALAPPSSG